ncbi:Protein of unknown function [Thermoactinomyces sp. DSM 45891]|uniref:Uncharacterized protein DUF2757 n=1 Tax=Baia soyae TaxID=1544746 RepID=A0A4V2SX27_9BACL|nr:MULTISPECIES: anti-sigma-F factor Fin [Thermoactinomycetaceae]TCP64646.1 uncharacterized protein DUF2757 [Baia soyae]SFX40000.1 Protein of unknown function [Thermoactinomyces sp. DSM 45891]
MAWEYVCPHCQLVQGRFEQSQVSDVQLGLDRLTPEEWQDIITNDEDGTNRIWVTCDTCQQVFDQYPERTVLPHLYS